VSTVASGESRQTVTMPRLAAVMVSIGVFLVASLLLGLGWSRVSPAYYGVIAPPVANLIEKVSPDVVWITDDDAAGPILVLENNVRKRTLTVLEKTAKLIYPVFVALLVAGLALPPTRSNIAGRSGLWRVPLGVVLLVGFHVLLATLVVCYAAAYDNRGYVPRTLRVTTSLTDVTQAFVPFVLFGLMYWPWRRRPLSDRCDAA